MMQIKTIGAARTTRTHENQENLSILGDRLEYNQETGKLTWRVRRRGYDGGVNPGDEAGNLNSSGYIAIKTCGRLWLAHRIAWALNYGVWPKEYIDHINGIRSDNRIANLRDATSSLNAQNVHGAQKNNRSGSAVPGVSIDKGKNRFRVTATINGKQTYIGVFRTLLEAESASLATRRAKYAGNML